MLSVFSKFNAAIIHNPEYDCKYSKNALVNMTKVNSIVLHSLVVQIHTIPLSMVSVIHGCQQSNRLRLVKGLEQLFVLILDTCLSKYRKTVRAISINFGSA